MNIRFYDILHLILVQMMYKLVWYVLTEACGKGGPLVTAQKVTVTFNQCPNAVSLMWT